MKNLIFFISSFGFGHLNRTIAIIRTILKTIEGIRIHFFGHQKHCNFFKKSIRNYIKNSSNEILTYPAFTDIGFFYQQNKLYPNIQKTVNNAYSFYIHKSIKLEKKITRMLKYYSNSLFCSDISPLAFDIAKNLDSFSVGISNFDWYSVFNNLPTNNFKNKLLLEKITEKLKSSYKKMDLLFRLPLYSKKTLISLNSTNVMDVNFFCRKKTLSKDRFNNKFNIDTKTISIFISNGMSIKFPSKEASLTNIYQQKFETSQRNLMFFTSSNNKNKFFKKIPTKETESQNWIGNCDIFVGKPGWGSISEAMLNNVKMVLIPINENIESVELTKQSQSFGGSITLSREDFLQGIWLNKIIYNKIPNYTKMIKGDGDIQIVSEIIKLI